MRALLAFTAVLFGPANANASPNNQPVTVFAAASLKNILDDLYSKWQESKPECDVTLVFAGTPTLARQIEHGAPADIFIAANPEWMDYLAKSDRIEVSSRFNFASNRLVLIKHGSAQLKGTIGLGVEPWPELLDAPFAIALADAVPAGIYAKAALQSLNWWEQIAPVTLQADSVRLALRWVAAGEATHGIVYRSDTQITSDVSVIGEFDPDLHPPILYPAAIVADRQSECIIDFHAFLGSGATRKVLPEHGFIPPEEKKALAN